MPRGLAFLIVMILLLTPTPALAQPPADRVSTALVVTSSALAGADVAMSMRCIGAGTCREQNPFLRPLQDTPVWYGGVRAGLQVGLVLAIQRYTKPRTARRYLAYGVVIGVQAAVVALNTSQRHAGVRR